MIRDESEDPGERARRYIANFEKTLETSTIVEKETLAKSAGIARVSDGIQRYLRDARYYIESNRATTALASIAYAEGLLDALVFLGLAKTESAEK